MKRTLLVMLVLSIVGIVYAADTEEIELTTYYPAPYGDYEGLYVTTELGVGTSHPFGELDVRDGKISTTHISGSDTIACWRGLSVDAADITAQVEPYIWTSHSRGIRFGTDTGDPGSGTGTEFMRITKDGNVGIGTTTPASTLEVAGIINAGIGSGETYTGSNLGMGVKFYSKGANSSSPNLVHPAGRIYGHNTSNGWENQMIAMEAASNWTANNSLQLVLRGDNTVHIGGPQALIVAGATPEALNISGGIKLSGDIIRHNPIGTEVTLPWPDYVFDSNYSLATFAELRDYINNYRQLPGVPSADEVQKNGVELFTQQARLLEKLEESYLYILQLEINNCKLHKRILIN